MGYSSQPPSRLFLHNRFPKFRHRTIVARHAIRAACITTYFHHNSSPSYLAFFARRLPLRIHAYELERAASLATSSSSCRFPFQNNNNNKFSLRRYIYTAFSSLKLKSLSASTVEALPEKQAPCSPAYTYVHAACGSCGGLRANHASPSFVPYRQKPCCSPTIFFFLPSR